MNRIAEYAIRAAKNWDIWGRWAAIRYAIKRRVPMRLLGLAVALEKVKKLWR